MSQIDVARDEFVEDALLDIESAYATPGFPVAVEEKKPAIARKISVIGLGYVGLPVAASFGRATRVVGFDINAARIDELKTGRDRTGEVSAQALATANIAFTRDPAALAEADFHIVAVPTPVTASRTPDLGPLIAASQTVGRQLKKGDIVVYESTVYPGATEEDCVPVLERESGLVFGRDFTVGYSPERINPGDTERRFETITKIVSGSDQRTLDIVAEVYGAVVTAGVHRAPSIKVAEAAKVIENSQRDLNIAFVNELAQILDKIDVPTKDVLEAAGTKWNFLDFKPGLVGGHCIGVDPYYLTSKAQAIGYHPEIILAGRRINDGMAAFIVSKTVQMLIAQGLPVRNARVGVLGVTFKENVPDLRNSRVADLLAELKKYRVQAIANDPMADPHEMEEEIGAPNTPLDQFEDLDALILAVPHRAYLRGEAQRVLARMTPGRVVVDLKGVLDRDAIAARHRYWSL